MSKCECCGNDEMNCASCKSVLFEFSDGMKLKPIPYGKEKNPIPLYCDHCSAPRGGFHHLGCENEECPRCHRQAIGCSCKQVLSNQEIKYRALVTKKSTVKTAKKLGNHC